jgi:hypothetical protein
VSVTSNAVVISVAHPPSGWSIKGTVTSASTGLPLAGVKVRLTDLNGSYKYITSGASGGYAFYQKQDGTYPLHFALTGYVSGTLDVTVNGANVKGADIALAPM